MNPELDAGWSVQVAIVGAGPAGIAAAVAAADHGASVVLLDEGLRPGGQIWRHTTRHALPAAAQSWLARLDRSGARLHCRASVLDITTDLEITAETDGRAVRGRAEAVILATGARERFLPFPGWTLPNVFGVGGAQALAKSGMRFGGKRVVVAGSGPLLLPVAALLAGAGAQLSLVAEQAPASAVARFAASLWRWPRRWWQAARYRAAFPRARYRPGTWVVRAAGDDAVREVTLTDGRREWTEPCEALCVGYGLVPATELARLLGCDVMDGQVAVDAWQRTSRPGVYCAGEPTGVAGLEASLAEGEIAGHAVTGRAATTALAAARAGQRRFANQLRDAFALRAELRELPEPDTVVCRCEDVRYARFRPDWTMRQAKLYTRAGMGPCQGRVCGAALEFLWGYGADTVRVPVSPVRVGTLRLPDSAVR